MKEITFETKCYENDWEFLLKTSYLDEMVKRCHTDFACKQLLINNVNDISQVRKFADTKVKEGIIDVYYIVDDYAKEALNFFELSKESLGKGYYYSIAELVGLYLSRTPYHLHFSSDARMEKKTRSNWIQEAITLMEVHPDYAVANAMWNRKFKEVEKQPLTENGNFRIGYGFSDQCYLVNTRLFRQPIYNEHHPLSDRFPKYGGELFEKRVDSYIRNQDLKRITHTYDSYLHRNFPKNKLFKQVFKYTL